ncbi:MAG: DUF4270 family protein [Paludibacteraceae bacterium]|nr:DUF4270 family protein [Paludibacteraceae bacterium]MBQ8704990.1 DUF4270 family protein [Paludibacteraceae bacterium]
MYRRFAFIGFPLLAVMLLWTACKDDVTTTGESILDENDAIIVLADTFSISSAVDSCDAIISQADSFLLGEIETDYGVLRASVLTQLACPEGYTYPEGFTVDSICLFMYYSSWVGDDKSPLAINAYLMDKNTFRYNSTYPTDLNIDDYCTRGKSILTNHRIVVASEKRDSILNTDGQYIPMVRMRVNDDFMQDFASITNFESQDKFNEQFKGLLLETSFGSATMLNISDVALGVFYHFQYNKAGKDTTVSDMKAFYANSEVRTVNQLVYRDKKEWVETLQQDSDTYNYIIAPAGVYTRLRIPMEQITDKIFTRTELKRPYVNKAEIRVSVMNMDPDNNDRNDWLLPSSHMLLIKEKSMTRFFKNRELPSDTCALLGQLTQGVDSVGDAIYYYSYDMSDFLTNQLRKEENDSILDMLLVPVTINTATTNTSSTAVTSVRQQQTISATKIRSAKNGMKLEIVYSGF